MYGEMLLSKVIENNDVGAFTRFNVKETDFLSEGERQVYRFIVEYAERNNRNAPDYRTVLTSFPDFVFTPNVTETYDYLVFKLKSRFITAGIADLVMNELETKIKTADGFDVADWMMARIEDLKRQAEYREKVGVSIKTDYERFIAEYQRRKIGESVRVWKSKFPTINEQIGGYISGNMYTWYARSGRGKSVLTMEEAIEAAMQGARVLVWALEMSEFEWYARAYSSISARKGVFTAKIDGIDYEAGFDQRAILFGRLETDYEEKFFDFVRQLNDILPGEIILRAADHENFYSRSVRDLEHDIERTKADVVVVDPIYYMDFERNTSKTAGGDVANTSKALRRLAGRTKVVMHVITQADETDKERDKKGDRQLRPPRRNEIKKTKAVLEDAANTFGLDTLDGRGVIEVGKGRFGGEGVRVELIYLPNYGIVKEVSFEEMADQFVEF